MSDVATTDDKAMAVTCIDLLDSDCVMAAASGDAGASQRRHGCDDLAHNVLIKESAKWLRAKGCCVVITDMTHGGPETADAIGWRGKRSTVIECKASVSDFRADVQKSFRRYPESGMGCVRYFCAMQGTLNPEKLPPKWGLLEWDGRKMREIKKPDDFRETSARDEISLLLSALRRVAVNAPEGVSVKCYTMSSKNRATLGITPAVGHERIRANGRAYGEPPNAEISRKADH